MSARTDHVAWSKRRALAELDRGDLGEAVASMMSDMSKRDDTRPPAVLLQLGMLGVVNGDRDGVRRWIEGFN